MSAYVSRRSRRLSLAAAGAGMLLAFAARGAAAPAGAGVIDATEPAAQARTSPSEPHLVLITAADAPKAGAVGKWQVDYPTETRPFRANLTSAGGKLTGAITMAQRSFEVFDGRLQGNTVTFTVKSPTGNRTITFKGTASGDRMTFTRDVSIGPGGLPGGEGIFGADGPKQFAANRVK